MPFWQYAKTGKGKCDACAAWIFGTSEHEKLFKNNINNFLLILDEKEWVAAMLSYLEKCESDFPELRADLSEEKIGSTRSHRRQGVVGVQ